MPKAGNSNQKAAARRVQRELTLPYTVALRKVTEAKTPGLSWEQAADNVIVDANPTTEA